MVVGIDLGTTNSLLGFSGNIVTGLVPSSVDMASMRQINRDAVGDNIVSSYKTDMSMSDTGATARVCSTVILKHLCDLCKMNTGFTPYDAIISVPAYFSTSQREAVLTAGTDAGLNVIRLINEPTAAALYVCKDISDLVVVYDLGGGTFDITIVDTRTGSYSVVATDGCVLGGDDLDDAIVNDIISSCHIAMRFLSSMFRKQLKIMATNIKERIQSEMCDVSILISFGQHIKEYSLSVDKYKKLVRDVFGITFTKTKELIDRYIPYGETPKVVYVGGSTACPYLREMLHDELGLYEIITTMMPDQIVAAGAIEYADMITNGCAFDIVEDVTKGLLIEDRDGHSIQIIPNNSMIPCKECVVVSNSEYSDTLNLRLYQGDMVIANMNDYIGTLVYKYDYPVSPGDGIVNVSVEITESGIIQLSAWGIIDDEDDAQRIQLRER